MSSPEWEVVDFVPISLDDIQNESEVYEKVRAMLARYVRARDGDNDE